MSYFDGIIPEICAACFHWQAGKWEIIDSGMCGECAYTLEMFPVLEKNGGINKERYQLLEVIQEPDWRFLPAKENR
ncbi:MAG: hypothetical protein K2O18_05090 [Oscillospiraceae bacterium]|nr:hypothetical protein [Oscillospiraceae bacterium]